VLSSHLKLHKIDQYNVLGYNFKRYTSYEHLIGSRKVWRYQNNNEKP